MRGKPRCMKGDLPHQAINVNTESKDYFRPRMDLTAWLGQITYPHSDLVSPKWNGATINTDLIIYCVISKCFYMPHKRKNLLSSCSEERWFSRTEVFRTSGQNPYFPHHSSQHLQFGSCPASCILPCRVAPGPHPRWRCRFCYCELPFAVWHSLFHDTHTVLSPLDSPCLFFFTVPLLLFLPHRHKHFSPTF